jgi:hypothetical protein
MSERKLKIGALRVAMTFVNVSYNTAESRLSERRSTEIPYYPRCHELYHNFAKMYCESSETNIRSIKQLIKLKNVHNVALSKCSSPLTPLTRSNSLGTRVEPIRVNSKDSFTTFDCRAGPSRPSLVVE